VNERIRQFYADHREAILTGAVVGVVTGFVLMKKMDAKKLSSADLFTREDGRAIISVNLKDGSSVQFAKSLVA
jgi:hypothetical protein